MSRCAVTTLSKLRLFLPFQSRLRLRRKVSRSWPARPWKWWRQNSRSQSGRLAGSRRRSL